MASNRYEFTSVSKDTLGNRKYETTMYPKISKSSSDVYVVARKGDRLDLLADSYYKDSTLWWVIAQANHLGKGSVVISKPQRLRIPTNINLIVSNLEEFQRNR